MQQPSVKATGCPDIPPKRNARSDDISDAGTNARRSSRSTAEPPNAREPLAVTQEAVDAYELRTGFHGIGRIMVDDGHWVIVTREELARSRAHAVKNRRSPSRHPGVA